MTAKNLFSLAGFLLASFAAGAIGSQFMLGDWYRALNKPSWNPPGWLFGPVWSVLYAMMGVSAWRIWRVGGFGGAPVAMGLFAFQLVLNAAWSWLFFGLHRMDLAFFEIIVLWFAILGTAIAFRRIDRPAAWMLVPYLAWVAFATVLNGAFWRLNPG